MSEFPAYTLLLLKLRCIEQFIRIMGFLPRMLIKSESRLVR